MGSVHRRAAPSGEYFLLSLLSLVPRRSESTLGPHHTAQVQNATAEHPARRRERVRGTKGSVNPRTEGESHASGGPAEDAGGRHVAAHGETPAPAPRDLAPWENLPSVCVLQTWALKISGGASDTFRAEPASGSPQNQTHLASAEMCFVNRFFFLLFIFFSGCLVRR